MAVAAASLLLCACAAVGPDHRRPESPASRGYVGGEASLPGPTASAPGVAGAAQQFDPGAMPRQWWTLLGSSRLNALVDQALREQPNVEAAQAALVAAQDLLAAQRASLWPTAQLQWQSTRNKLSADNGGNAPTGAGTVYNYHTGQLSVTYVADVFGAARRQTELADVQVAMQRQQLSATRLTLAANVVAAVIQDAALREQRRVAEASVDSAQEALALVQRQQRGGLATALDVAQQVNALAAARQALPPLHRAIETGRHALAQLLGLPADATLPPLPDLADLTLPERLPVELPSQLVARRPDILLAEAQAHAAAAQVGIATAARLPQITLSANAGGMGQQASSVFTSGGRFFNLGLDLVQPLFDAGALAKRQDAARAQWQQAVALYRAAVLQSFQNVADSLSAIVHDAQALQQAALVEDSATQTAALALRQMQAGYVDRLTWLSAERARQQAVLGTLQARAARLTDTVALCQAVAGADWRDSEHRDE